jgi:hypothetical protein
MDPLMDDPGLDSGLWVPAAPAPIVAVPAAQVASLRGRRVTIGGREYGWCDGLRADEAVEQDGQAMVPVLGEYDYYRAELDQIEVFAPLVPLDQVWVEQPAPTPNPQLADEPRDLLSRLVSLATPPARRPVPARDTPGITGRRVVVVSPSREKRDVRAASEPYERADGTICLRLCEEPQWYRWAFTGQAPRTVETPIYLIWAE